MKIDHFIAACLIIGSLFLVFSHLSTNNLDFSRYNTGWNGTSTFFDRFDRHSTDDLKDPSVLIGRHNTTLFIIAPDILFSGDEISRYRTFVEEGNSIFLADESGFANTILRGIGSSIIILPGTLGSVDRAYNNSHAIVTYVVEENAYTTGVPSLVLNKAAALEGGDPLIKTTLMSWIDTDKDGRITKKEMLGKYTVFTHEKLGKGEVFVLSDPSFCTNGMQNPGHEWGNTRFIDNICTANQWVLIDQTHSKTAGVDGYSMIIQMFRSSPVLIIASISVICMCLFIIVRRKLNPHE